MGNIVITWPQLAVVAILVVGVYVAELLLFMRRSGQPQRHRINQLETEIDSLRDDLVALRRELAASRMPVAEEPEPVPASEVDSPYSQAIRLARQGLDSAAVAAGCGISRGEAELIVALYRGRSRS
ncbi:DUF2802 domain-containing protein [Parachitinimonas caeni]|uniref:DUF2802 domain-containing protein n=1 Tax=Parachitinimonas caeni TaxID=3031301 RepID=A0ABT7E2Z4_9NEIS|nr:DUF2802 domain-containing protein [Parachitinimonas caeni]MDK2126414.1 DUF2802 domain-containing protein [Parachitinimonas caeni]